MHESYAIYIYSPSMIDRRASRALDHQGGEGEGPLDYSKLKSRSGLYGPLTFSRGHFQMQTMLRKTKVRGLLCRLQVTYSVCMLTMFAS